MTIKKITPQTTRVMMNGVDITGYVTRIRPDIRPDWHTTAEVTLRLHSIEREGETTVFYLGDRPEGN